jgi:ribonuclease D
MTPDMLPPPTWIDLPQTFQQMTGELSRHPSLAVDTESNSLHAYREQVCLIQFSTPATDFLVDPLALDDLASLAPIFSNPGIEKVFHAVEYDLICLNRDFGITVVNIFDTMQAARILGYKQVGLDAMLGLKLGIKVDKRYQKADWGRRPLTPELLSYARLDTHYLLELRAILKTELVVRGRWELAWEEFARLSRGTTPTKVEIPPWQRISGTQKFNDQQLAILKELCAWREAQARRMNRPMFKVMDDRRLAMIAESTPQSLAQLQELELTSRQIEIYGNDLIQAVALGRQAKPVRRSQHPRLEDDVLNRLEALSEWRKRTAEKMGVESDIVLPKPFMHAIAEKNPHTLDELSELMPDSPWRLIQFGRDLLTLVNTTSAKRGRNAKKKSPPDPQR